MGPLNRPSNRAERLARMVFDMGPGARHIRNPLSGSRLVHARRPCVALAAGHRPGAADAAWRFTARSAPPPISPRSPDELARVDAGGCAGGSGSRPTGSTASTAPPIADHRQTGRSLRKESSDFLVPWEPDLGLAIISSRKAFHHTGSTGPTRRRRLWARGAALSHPPALPHRNGCLGAITLEQHPSRAFHRPEPSATGSARPTARQGYMGEAIRGRGRASRVSTASTISRVREGHAACPKTRPPGVFSEKSALQVRRRRPELSPRSTGAGATIVLLRQSPQRPARARPTRLTAPLPGRAAHRPSILERGRSRS